MERPIQRAHPPPLLIAHRAGNDLRDLEAVRPLAPDLIEADVHYFRGRLEVRHSKTIGPIRILWDRNPWRLENPFADQLTFDELLTALSPSEELFIDVKGLSNDIVDPIITAVETLAPGRRMTVCSRNWQILPRFAERPWARVVYSVGNRAQVDAIFRRPRVRDAVAINHRLLTPSLARRIRAKVPLLMTWTVDDPAIAKTLVSWGVNGVITDAPRALRSTWARS